MYFDWHLYPVEAQPEEAFLPYSMGLIGSLLSKVLAPKPTTLQMSRGKVLQVLPEVEYAVAKALLFPDEASMYVSFCKKLLVPHVPSLPSDNQPIS